MSLSSNVAHTVVSFAPINNRDMRLIDFMNAFPDEASCKSKLKEYREKQGVVCPHCGSTQHYWKKDKQCFECKHCHYRQSLKANTVMHGSQLPLRYWFIAMHLLTSTKKSFSAAELKRQLGHKNYTPIWALLHKLRNAMGKRDSEYEICGMVELDEGFFSTEVPDDEKDKPLKRGKGSQKKSKVLVMAQTDEGTPSKKSDKPTSVKYIKMFVIEDLKSETIDEKVKMYIDPNSTIKSDDSKSYTNFSTIVKEHIHQVIEPKQVGKVLPWVHIAIANAKRLLLDVYHDIRPEYLQNYLNEFCWKFNRRNFGDALFDRLMVAAVSYKNQFRYNIE